MALSTSWRSIVEVMSKENVAAIGQDYTEGGSADCADYTDKALQLNKAVRTCAVGSPSCFREVGRFAPQVHLWHPRNRRILPPWKSLKNPPLNPTAVLDDRQLSGYRWRR
jgi:hypothetical protein